MRKKAERLAAVEAEKEMLEKQSDDLALERDTNKKDLAEANKAIAAQGATIATLESKLTQKEDAIALVAAKNKEIGEMKEALIAANDLRAKEKIDDRGAFDQSRGPPTRQSEDRGAGAGTRGEREGTRGAR